MDTITDMTVEELTERAAGIAQGAMSVGGLNEENRNRADDDIRTFIGDIYVRYDDARQGNENNSFPSEEWFDEKLSAFRSFLLMGIGSVMNFVYLGWPMRVSDTVTR